MELMAICSQYFETIANAGSMAIPSELEKNSLHADASGLTRMHTTCMSGLEQASVHLPRYGDAQPTKPLSSVVCTSNYLLEHPLGFRAALQGTNHERNNVAEKCC